MRQRSLEPRRTLPSAWARLNGDVVKVFGGFYRSHGEIIRSCNPLSMIALACRH